MLTSMSRCESLNSCPYVSSPCGITQCHMLNLLMAIYQKEVEFQWERFGASWKLVLPNSMHAYKETRVRVAMVNHHSSRLQNSGLSND